MINRKKERFVWGRSTLWPMYLIILATFFIMGAPRSAQAQWSAPDGGSNISNTNSGNVGIGMPTGTSPGTKLDVGGAVRGINFFGPQQTAFTVGTDSTVSGGAAIQMFGTSGSGGMTNQIRFLTGSSSQYRMVIDGGGNVGIGTTSPGYRLTTSGSGDEKLNIISTTAGNGAAIMLQNTGNANSPRMEWQLIPSSTEQQSYMRANYIGATVVPDIMVIRGDGNIGVGTTNPQARLDVNGNINVTGNINAKYQDVAEWVQSRQKLTAGTVVVLDPEKSNQVIASTESYDTRVAGVISEQPGVLLGEGGEGKVKVATTGRVRVRVNASKGSVRIGDLLVTSDKEGMAMKSDPVNVGGIRMHRPGTIIGKALEPLREGTGEIMVLLSLQ
jgi:hypothetical protein